ncbi:MAG: hypothetical protein ACFFD2_30680 [Promethearchaeota archaeon]
MSIAQQISINERSQEKIPPAHCFKKMGMLVVEPNARKILINYLDSQNFYKIAPDIFYFRKKLENYVLFLSKTIAIHRNHDYVEPHDMKVALVLYFHLITTRDFSRFLNLDKIDGTKLFILHQLPLFSFYRNLIRRTIAKDAAIYNLNIRERMNRLLDNIGDLKRKYKKEILVEYMNALEITSLLQEKNTPDIVITKKMFEKSQRFIKRILFDNSVITDIDTLYSLYRLLKNSQLLMDLCSIEIPWEIMKFLKTTQYYKNDIRISRKLQRNYFCRLEYNQHLLLNFLQFLSKIYALKQNAHINQESFEILFRLLDKLMIIPSIEQIEHIQISIFPNWNSPTETQIRDFLFTTFKKDCTKHAKEYLIQLKKWFSHLLVKHLGRRELLLNHPKFVIQIITVLLFLAYRNAYFTRHSKIDRDDIKTAFNQFSYLLLDAKFSYLK